jgi:RNA polymerase sigma-70 factor (ECF subfamily)
MEDRELIQSCLDGNLEQFGRIVERYGAQTMALAMNILGNREDAQDASQEAFIQAFRNLGQFDIGRNFKPWLFAILYRRCLDRLKKHRRLREALSRMKIEKARKLNPGAVARSADPSTESRSISPVLLEILSPKERAALCLWANEGYSAVEISRVIGCSANTARVYLFNARKKIRVRLEKTNVRL